jgi:hypothetical protein
VPLLAVQKNYRLDYEGDQLLQATGPELININALHRAGSMLITYNIKLAHWSGHLLAACAKTP